MLLTSYIMHVCIKSQIGKPNSKSSLNLTSAISEKWGSTVLTDVEICVTWVQDHNIIFIWYQKTEGFSKRSVCVYLRFSTQEEIFLDSCSVIMSIENGLMESTTDPIFCLNQYRLSGSVVLFLACFPSEFCSHFSVTGFQQIS